MYTLIYWKTYNIFFLLERPLQHIFFSITLQEYPMAKKITKVLLYSIYVQSVQEKMGRKVTVGKSKVI